MTQVTGWQSCRGEAGTWEDCFGEDSEQSSHSAESSVRTVGNSELYSKRSSKIVPTPTSTARTCKSDSIWHPFAPSDPREPTISPWDFPQQEEQAVVTGTIGVYITGDPHENVRAIPLQVMQTPEAFREALVEIFPEEGETGPVVVRDEDDIILTGTKHWASLFRDGGIYKIAFPKAVKIELRMASPDDDWDQPMSLRPVSKHLNDCHSETTIFDLRRKISAAKADYRSVDWLEDWMLTGNRHKLEDNKTIGDYPNAFLDNKLYVDVGSTAWQKSCDEPLRCTFSTMFLSAFDSCESSARRLSSCHRETTGLELRHKIFAKLANSEVGRPKHAKDLVLTRLDGVELEDHHQLGQCTGWDSTIHVIVSCQPKDSGKASRRGAQVPVTFTFEGVAYTVSGCYRNTSVTTLRYIIYTKLLLNEAVCDNGPAENLVITILPIMAGCGADMDPQLTIGDYMSNHNMPKLRLSFKSRGVGSW